MDFRDEARGVEEQGREHITPEIEKRQHRRVKLLTQVRCETLGREALLLTRDVSAGGVFISTPNPFPANSEVALSFRLGPDDPLLSCRGKVVHAVRGVGMGIQFIESAADARLALQKFVDESN